MSRCPGPRAQHRWRLLALLALCVAALPPAAARANHETLPLRVILICAGVAPLEATAHIDVDGLERRIRMACAADGDWIAEDLVSPAADAGRWEIRIAARVGEDETVCEESGRRLPMVLACATGRGDVQLSLSSPPFPDLPLRAEPGDLTSRQRAAIFDAVRDQVDGYYVDPAFNGLDWNELAADYRKRALSAEDTVAFYAVLQAMIGELGDDHSSYLSPWQALTETVAGGDGGTYEGVGFVGAYEEDALLVFYVYPGGPAERAGLRPRDRIVAVDGEPVSAGAAGVELEPDAHTPVYSLDGQPTAAQRDPLGIRGPAGTRVKLTVVSPGLGPNDLRRGRIDREIEIEREVVTAEIIPVARRLDAHPEVGYVQIPTFMTDTTPELAERTLTNLFDDGPLDGLILDLRGNPGGHIVVLEQLLGLFIEGEVATIAGQHAGQAYAYPVVIEARPLAERLEQVELVILIDRYSNSSAELMAGILQAEGRATVAGEASAGNVEWLLTSVLADGSVVSVANGVWNLANGPEIEGRGVIPDHTVRSDWTRFTEARDPYLRAAIAALTS